MRTGISVPTDAERAVILGVQANTAENAKRSNGLIIVPDLDLDNLPYYYRLNGPAEEKHRRVSSIGSATLRTIGASALDDVSCMLDDRYGEFLGSNRTAQLEVVTNSIAKDMKDGLDVTLGLGHVDFRDVPIPNNFISAELTRRGIKHQTAFIVAKGLDYAEINVARLGLSKAEVDAYLRPLGLSSRKNGNLSMRTFFRLFANQTIFTIPDTLSFADLRADKDQKDVIDTFSRNMFTRLLRLRAQSDVPVLLTIAAPGTTNKLLDPDAYKPSSDYAYYPHDFKFNTNDPVEVVGTPQKALSKMFKDTRFYVGATKLIPGQPIDVAMDPEPQEYDFGKIEDYEAFLKQFYAVHRQLFDTVVIDMGGKNPLPTMRRTA